MEMPLIGIGASTGWHVAERAEKPIIISRHAWRRLRERGASEDAVLLAVRIGAGEPAHRGLTLYRLDVPFGGTWRGRRYETMQVAAVLAEERDERVVVTVYTFFFSPFPPRESPP